MDQLNQLYLLMENPYRKDEHDRVTISGFLPTNKIDKLSGERGYWVRFCYFYNTNQLVCTNTRSGEVLVKNQIF